MVHGPLDSLHVWDSGQARVGERADVLGEWVFNAAQRYDRKVPDCSKVSGVPYTGIDKQRELVGKLQKLRIDALKQGAGVWDRARLEGVAAPHAGAWLDAPPSRVQDMRMTNPEVCSRVGRRLGVALCEEMACPFCFCALDKWGAHAECCMSGGDKTAAHHCVRNRIYIHARGAGAVPVLEAADVLNVLGIPGVGVEPVGGYRWGPGAACRRIIV